MPNNTNFKQEISLIALAGYVDRLAAVKAALSELKTEEELIKRILVTSEHTVIEGSLHRASISHCEGREIVDWRAVAEKLKPSRQLVQAHTSVGEPYDVVRLSAKKTS